MTTADAFIAQDIDIDTRESYGYGHGYAGQAIRARGWLKVGNADVEMTIALSADEGAELRRILNAAGRRVMGEIAGKVAARLEGET